MYDDTQRHVMGAATGIRVVHGTFVWLCIDPWPSLKHLHVVDSLGLTRPIFAHGLYRPVEPKPPTPRSVSSSASTSKIGGVAQTSRINFSGSWGAIDGGHGQIDLCGGVHWYWPRRTLAISILNISERARKTVCVT